MDLIVPTPARRQRSFGRIKSLAARVSWSLWGAQKKTVMSTE